jgi:hypothetical protein
MLTTVNPGGFVFKWHDGSDVIEVFHNEAAYPEAPVEVVIATGLRYNQSELNRFANESPEYGRY